MEKKEGGWGIGKQENEVMKVIKHCHLLAIAVNLLYPSSKAETNALKQLSF